VLALHFLVLVPAGARSGQAPGNNPNPVWQRLAVAPIHQLVIFLERIAKAAPHSENKVLSNSM
jgi:hypothetical protein